MEFHTLAPVTGVDIAGLIADYTWPWPMVKSNSKCLPSACRSLCRISSNPARIPLPNPRHSKRGFLESFHCRRIRIRRRRASASFAGPSPGRNRSGHLRKSPGRIRSTSSIRICASTHPSNLLLANSSNPSMCFSWPYRTAKASKVSNGIHPSPARLSTSPQISACVTPSSTKNIMKASMPPRSGSRVLYTACPSCTGKRCAVPAISAGSAATPPPPICPFTPGQGRLPGRQPAGHL